MLFFFILLVVGVKPFFFFYVGWVFFSIGGGSEISGVPIYQVYLNGTALTKFAICNHKMLTGHSTRICYIFMAIIEI